MLTIVTASSTALFISASSLVYAQVPSQAPPVRGTVERLSTADWSTLTNARINIVKAALQLTADQEKYWPAIENAIRARAQDRQERIANVEERVEQRRGELRSGGLAALRDRNPVDFVRRRAEALAQRADDLKKLADAWQPLYETLSQDQKRRLSFLTIYVLREMRNGLEERLLQDEEDGDQG